MKDANKILLVLVALSAIATVGFYVSEYKGNGEIVINNPGNADGKGQAAVNSFDECEAAGYAIAESYPRQCTTPDGKAFVEGIGNELEKADLIKVSSPRPNGTVTSPLEVTGEARGYWYFEASFPVKIYDASGKELGTAVAEATDDWMTNEFVPFKATLTFAAPESGKGYLVLQKNNPSGLKENDDSLIMPIKFGQAAIATPAGETQPVSLYYYNAGKDKDARGNVLCSKQGLAAVPRSIGKTTSTNIADTVRLLLKGELSDAEKQQGISTEFPLAGFELEKAALGAKGGLTLTFKDPQNKTSGGSCRVSVLYAQIEATAKQFPEVKSVKILPAAILQP